MELKTLLEDLEYELLQGSLESPVASVEYDSRKVAPGSLFVAIKGYETDGHLYIGKAVGEGASAIILEDRTYAGEVPEGCTLVRVPDSRKALALISASYYGHPARALKVIGVTGTNGKTSITYLLKNILKEAGFKVGIVGTIENQIDDVVQPSSVTTPESRDLQHLLRQMADKGCSYCIMEASSHALYLDRVAGIPFKAAIFTNLSQDHLDFHKDLEDYLQAKMRLFKYVTEDGFSIVNADEEAGRRIAAMASGSIASYSLHQPSDFRARDIRMDLQGTRYTLDIGGKPEEVRLKLIGEFSIYNSLAAIATALSLGIPVQTVLKGVAGVSVNGRFQLVESRKDFAVVVDYAHTPDGLLNVLQTARKIAAGRVICVFGCGGDRDRTKRPLMGRVAGEWSDQIIITSDNPRTEDPDSIIAMVEAGAKEVTDSYLLIENRKEAIRKAIELAAKGDIIVIAGKGHEDYQIIGKIKYPFSDLETAREILNEEE